MKTQALGPTDLHVSRLCYGAMRISGSWDQARVDAAAIERGIQMLETAVEAGYTFIDHADIYGDTTCEMIHGRALDRHPDWRDKLVVATKCGIRFENEPKGAPHRYDLSRKHILDSVEASLRRLKLDRIDLYQFHRPDFLLDPLEAAQAMAELHQAGKVRHFGVSNFKPSQVGALQSALPFPLISNQVEIHLLRLDPFEDGTLDQCLEKSMTPLAWSPVAAGRLGPAMDAAAAPPPENESKAAIVMRLRPLLAAIAKEYGVTPLAILLAWLMRHPAKIIPIYGSTRPEAIKEASKADTITLDRDNWYRILRVARGRGLE
ncbi:MAG: aldo/keto reductase [Methylacidiphilales bacterium]|nr:aldo/keto reductase [Candidatus Methylacidiphilales bacterium]